MHQRAARSVLGVAVLIARSGALGASSGEGECLAVKARAVAAAVEARGACNARDVEEPGSVGPECFVRSIAALPAALARADRLGPCGGVHSYLTEHVIDCIPFLQNTPNRCGGGKIRAGTALAVGKLRCLARAAGGLPDPACLARREARYRKAFARAERRGPCPGTIDYIATLPEYCISVFSAAFRCGNGVFDLGEECDGQLFCSPRGDCRIQRDIVCCTSGDICGDTIAEACLEGGFQAQRGTCIGTPCDLFPGCTMGTCQDPPIAASAVCCQRDASCEGTTVATTFDLRDALLACLDTGGQPLLGTCDASGHCAD